MDTGREGHEEAQSATPMSVETPISPSNSETETEPTQQEARPPQRGGLFSRQLRRPPVHVLGAAVLIALTFALVFADGGRTTASQGRLSPTPTATATVIPSPTAAPGFQMYVDQSDGFLIQYPHEWAYNVNRPGIQFVDDANNLGFVVDVIVLNDTSSAPAGADPNDGSIWVNHVMRDYASQFQDQFQQLPGPIPDAHFGGAEWRSGVALLGDGSSRVRVQVYATVHGAKPYVIAVLAADDIFSFGSTEYFGPMLQSFQFLTPS